MNGSLKNKVVIYDNIRNNLSQLSLTFQNLSSENLFHNPFRKQLFENYGYNSESFTDESYFINLFQTQLTNNTFESVEGNPKDFANFGQKYLETVNEVRNLSVLKCQEQKKAALRNYFILPSGNIEHVRGIMINIERKFSAILDETISTYQNYIKIRFSEFIDIKRPPTLSNIAPARFANSNKQILESFYEKNNRPNNNEKAELSRQTELTVKQIETWFNNKRNREGKDLQELELRTENFLREEMDWEERFNAIESGKETSKDMIIITTTALGLSDEEKETTSKLVETSPESNNSNAEITSSSRNSLVIRPRITKGTHKSTAPYTKQTPMVTKMTMMRSIQIEAGTSSENPIQTSSEDLQETTQYSVEFNISKQQSNTENFTTATSNKLKIRYRPNKDSARTKAQPYARIQNTNKEKDNNDISNITPVSQECLDLLRTSQSNVEPIAIANANNMTNITTYDVDTIRGNSYSFDYMSTLAPTIENLSNEFCSNWQMNANEYKTPSLSPSLSSPNQSDFSTSLMTTNTPLDNTIYLTPNVNSSTESLYDILFQNDPLNSNDNIYSTGWTTSDNFDYYPNNYDNVTQYNYIDPRLTFYSAQSAGNEKPLANTEYEQFLQ